MQQFLILAFFLLGATSPAAKESAKESVPFIKDDFAKAIAEAKAKNQPIFVEAWAPW